MSRMVRFQPCVFSNHIQSFCVRPGDKVVLWVRVSGRAQRRRGNLKDGESFLRAQVAKCQGGVVAVVTHVGAGWEPACLARLSKAAVIARQHGAILLAETTDRFVRHPSYHSKLRSHLQASDVDVEELLFAVGDVPLMTFLHPDASPVQVRSYQRRRGQQQKGRKGGRPRAKGGYKASHREDRLAVSKMFWGTMAGRSLRDIAARTGRPPATIQGWVNRYFGR
jgi:hypothetical protein